MPREKKLSGYTSKKGGCGCEGIEDESSLASSVESDSGSSHSSGSGSGSNSGSCPGGKGC